MTPKAKASVIGILALGAAGSIASMVRLAYVHVLGVRYDMLFMKAPDYAIASIIELGFGITAASLATLRPLFSKFLDKASGVLSSSRNKRTKESKGGMASEYGIVMERSVNVGYECSHELESMPESRQRGGSNGDSGIGSPINDSFSVSCKSPSPNVAVILESGNAFSDRRVARSQSQASSASEKSLLHVDRL